MTSHHRTIYGEVIPGNKCQYLMQLELNLTTQHTTQQSTILWAGLKNEFYTPLYTQLCRLNNWVPKQLLCPKCHKSLLYCKCVICVEPFKTETKIGPGCFHLYSDNVRFSRIGRRLISVTDELICSAPNQREICYILIVAHCKFLTIQTTKESSGWYMMFRLTKYSQFVDTFWPTYCQ